jgi:dTDP-glucose 4,6-dehydratase
MGILDSPRIKRFVIDLINPITIGVIKEIGDISYIVHFAADTHVDNSIENPVPFIHNNIMSTVNILEFARKLNMLEKFFYFSTDEVFGPALGTKSFTENEEHNSTNPYSSSKSGAEQICIAYKNTYKVPVIIVNVMNAMGERQHVEKFIPKVIQHVLEKKLINIHADKTCENLGSRYYIHCRNISSAVIFLIDKGTIGEKYNITGEKEINNLDMALSIANIMKKKLKYKIIDAETDRFGHDLRYSLNGDKLRLLGWEPPVNFNESLKNTVEWTLKNKNWLYCWD